MVRISEGGGKSRNLEATLPWGLNASACSTSAGSVIPSISKERGFSILPCIIDFELMVRTPFRRWECLPEASDSLSQSGNTPLITGISNLNWTDWGVWL